MILAAHNFGIGCCWVCHLPLKKQLRKILNIPSHYDPIAYIAMDYFKGTLKKRVRKFNSKEIISYNKFNFNERATVKDKLISIKRVLRKVYYYIPFKKHIKNSVDKLFEKKFE
jgi:hypothetical protein